MMNMEFVDTDYAVLLDYPERSVEMVDAKGMKEDPLESEQAKQESSRPVEEKAGWTFGYCQQLFDVTTEEVLKRIGQSIKPLPSTDFLTEVLQNKPDLYGPIWICVTLALELGLTSDLAHYLQFSAERPWRSSVNTVYRASVMLFLYSWCLPAVIWIVLEWNPVSEVKYKLMDLFCIYGYASAIFLPVAALWAMPIPWVRWVSVLMATFISGILICRSLKKAFMKLERCGYYAIQILLFVLNILIGICFNVFFFPRNPHPGNAIGHNSTLIPTPHYNDSSNAHITVSPMHVIFNLTTNHQFNNPNTTYGSFDLESL